MNQVIYQALVDLEGKYAITLSDPLQLGFVEKAIDNCCDTYDLYVIEQEAEAAGLPLETYIAISQTEMELHGRKRADENTVIEKRIGWVRWFETEQEANEWADSKLKMLPKINGEGSL